MDEKGRTRRATDRGHLLTTGSGGPLIERPGAWADGRLSERSTVAAVPAGTPGSEVAERAGGRDTRLWHPNANMAETRSRELVFDRAEGVWLWDEDGARYLDATAGLWYANVGHGRREIIDAVYRQMGRLDAYSVFGDYANRPALELAERLAALAPVDDARIFLGTGGGDAIEAAAKLARRYWIARDQPRRMHLIGRTGAFHGTNGFGTSVGGIETNRTGFGPLVGATSIVPHDDLDALERHILALGADHVAAFFMEPIIGAGGVLLPPEGYVEGVAELCARFDILLVADCVICAFGRLGNWFGVERWGIEPDMIAFAKGVTSGYQPLGGVVVSGKVAAPFWEGDGMALRHGATYAGHPAACAAALANLAVLEDEALLGEVPRIEAWLERRFATLADHPLVGEARAGVGAMAALEIAADPPGVSVAEVALAVRRHGVLVRPLGSSIAVSPPLTITDADLEFMADGIARGLDDAREVRPS